MKRRARRSFKRFLDQIRQTHPEAIDPESLIRSGQVVVDGRIVTNPASLVSLGASIGVVTPRVLRGEVKLQAALDNFQVSVAGRDALDVGASTGGFTRVLLRAGARRCYAVDTGHGQLLGSLRCDSRVVNLESTNLGDLNRRLVPEVIDGITMDLSYLSLASAVPQLDRIAIAGDADLVALVKPMFELALPALPEEGALLKRAVERAIQGIELCHWKVIAQMQSAVCGAGGAIEFFLRARRGRPSSRSWIEGSVSRRDGIDRRV
jgi:23S rRNA (cytidine1920-2'-O)/16S rRNA (cytidine1409-2'-O)-methyltransferase